MEGSRKNVRFSNGKLVISRKWWEIQLRLLLITNRKWHTPCQIGWKSLTLDDLEGCFAVLWLNGVRYGQCCYWSLIGSRILAFKWNENHGPWMILKVTDNQYGRLFQQQLGFLLSVRLLKKIINGFWRNFVEGKWLDLGGNSNASVDSGLFTIRI